MKQANQFQFDMLDLNSPEARQDLLWRAGRPVAAEACGGDVFLTVPFQAQKPGLASEPDAEAARVNYALRVRAYGEEMIRLTTCFAGEMAEDGSPMLELDPQLKRMALDVRTVEGGWEIVDERGTERARVNTAEPAVRPWSELLRAPEETLDLTVLPDGRTSVPLMAYDQFFPMQTESTPLSFVARGGRPQRAAFSFHAQPGECFAGTGERFAKMDLSGQTLVLENNDGLGVNSPRAYKNVPFYVSSRPYGLLALTSAHVRLSLGGVSTRAAQGVVEEPGVDLFVLGGGEVGRIVRNYHRLTGFPRQAPLWSYGVWMSRMTYFSAEEVSRIAGRLRQEDYPCDVLHIDTGWFAKDWICEWEFGERFPEPEKFMAEMRRQGYRVSLWQTPNIDAQCKWLELATEKRYVAPRKRREEANLSDFSKLESAGVIDFSNPEAVRWYQGLLENLLRMGASAIKTDFGEIIPMDSDYHGLPAETLHNLYALLYQRAAWEVTERVTGEPLIWARAGWVGCHRYPVHWGGDAACSWDGLAGSVRGGLHIGLSGFAFWSHDIPGFHGVPNFMNSWPSDALYMRWTQFGVFSSHMRYHGAQPREPYEYPAIASLARKWFKLRYALIPYIAAMGKKATMSGLPVLRALVFHHQDDKTCWHIDDQYYFGDELLVAPVMNDEGARDVYLPEGEWVDFWTGETLSGERWLRGLRAPLERMPVYARREASIPVYPEAVQCTDQMDPARVATLRFDGTYKGLGQSVLGPLTGFEA